MSRLDNLKRALRRLGEPYRPRSKRWPATGLTVIYGSDSTASPVGIKDISVSSIYLLTQERPGIGEQVSLLLRKQGVLDNGSEMQIPLSARVARLAEDGIVLLFVLPPGMDKKLFEVLLQNIVNVTDPDQGAEMFRTLRTFLFLCRLCGAGAEEAIVLLDGQLDAHRTANFFKMALAAENFVALFRDADRLHAHPKVVESILRLGSWAQDELSLQLWKGLLISSCSIDAPDDSNQVLVDMLVQMTPTQARILVYACERLLGHAPETKDSAANSIVLTSSEMIQLTGVHDRIRNATDLAYLFNLGLIEKLFDFTSYNESDNFDITPTSLGLELYKHCHGSREKIEPLLAEGAKEHLAVFLPPPIPSDFSLQARTSISLYSDQ